MPSNRAEFTNTKTEPTQTSTETTPTTTTTTEDKPKVVVSKSGPAQLTFPELLGNVVASVLADRTAMGKAKADISLWYAAQDPNTRIDIAKKTRADLEYSRGIIESAYQHFRELSFQDN